MTTNLTDQYCFRSKRLGFRNWNDNDIDKMIAISANENVMRYFPAIATPTQTKGFIARMQDLFKKKGYCYFAVDILETNEFIGFIGLNDVTYEAPFTPCVDIGWRLAEQYWGKGYATEGAKRCLKYAQELEISEVLSTAPQINTPSISVMQKIGMTKKLEFQHPKLIDYPALVSCVCYEISLV